MHWYYFTFFLGLLFSFKGLFLLKRSADSSGPRNDQNSRIPYALRLLLVGVFFMLLSCFLILNDQIVYDSKLLMFVA